MGKYALGVDFGTLSGRALLIDVETGKEVAIAEKEYKNGVIDSFLPNGKIKLEDNWALQNPEDYLDVLKETITEVIEMADIEASEIIGVGIDFTSCTVIPVDENYEPLCCKKEFEDIPHSYAKLWKHHAAQKEADEITEVLENGYEKLLNRYGGKISSEYLLPKIWQMFKEDKTTYQKTYKFIEAADWIVYQLTGQEKRNSCCAGYKGLWSKSDGYPPKSLLKSIEPEFENLVEEKLSNNVYSLGTKAGEITDKGKILTGLEIGTPVAVGIIDAHAAVLASGIIDVGKMLMIIGTSTCHMTLGKEEVNVPGICGVVEDGMIPGYFGYEAGQACVGDNFDWLIKWCIPSQYELDAKEKGLNMHDYLCDKIKEQKPGENGLLALDWWNGNRSILVDSDLSGLIIGCTLQTRPEDIYRALIEATAFGTRMIVDTFEDSGIKIDEIIACGGIANKNNVLMQIYSDVTNRVIKILDSPNATAHGAAMFGAIAAGKGKGGYDDIEEAAINMSSTINKCVFPNKRNVQIYDKMFSEYKQLYEYFGKGGNEVMKKLRYKKW